MIGIKGEAKQLSFDHKPQNESTYMCLHSTLASPDFPFLEEKTRIIAAGGYIEYGRVNGTRTLFSAMYGVLTVV